MLFIYLRKIGLCLSLGGLLVATAQGQSHLEQLREQLTRASTDSQKIQLLLDLAWFSKNIEPVQALHYGREALKLAQLKQREQHIADAFNHMGMVHLSLSNYPEALSYYQEALSIRKKLGLKSGTAGILVNIGNAYTTRERYAAALHHFLEALALAEQIQDSSKIATILNGIGVLYRRQDQWEKAAHYYQKSLKLSRQMKDTTLIVSLLNNLAILYQHQGQYEIAYQYFVEVIETTRDRNDQARLGTAYQNLANLFFKQQKNEEAMLYARKAIGIRGQLQDRLGLSTSYYLLGEIYQKQKNYALARSYAEQSLQVAQSLKAWSHIHDAGSLLIEIIRETQPAPALAEYYEIVAQAKDSLYRQDKARELIRLENKLEVQQKENEIQLLTQENQIKELKTKRQRYFIYLILFSLGLVLSLIVLIYFRYRAKIKANQLLSDQKQEKEILLKEIHHRVKNNLQIISSMLSLQVQHTRVPEVAKAMKEGQGRVEAMALIHQILYMTEEISHIDFPSYLENLVRSVFRAYNQYEGKVNYIIEAPALQLDINTAIPLGLIINELVSNALKYAFPHSGRGIVHLVLEKHDHFKYRLEIADNGVGLPHTDLQNISSDSLGLKLVRSLTRQLEGHLQIDNTRGTKFTIIFPKETNPG